MLRIVNLFIALSLGVHLEQFEQRMGLTWPRPFLLRPLNGDSQLILCTCKALKDLLGGSFLDHGCRSRQYVQFELGLNSRDDTHVLKVAASNEVVDGGFRGLLVCSLSLLS